MEKMRQWTLLAVVAVVVILAGGWFGLISKKRSEVSSLRADVATTEGENRRIQSEIAQLKEQAKQLPAQRNKLVQMSKQMPNHPALPALVRHLTDAADKAGLTLVSLEPAKPTMLEGAASRSTRTATTATSTTTVSDEVVAVIPVTITLNGDYIHILRFLDEVERMPRSLMLPEFSVEAEEPKAVSTDPNPSLGGSLTAELKARVFMTAPRPAPVVRRTSSDEDAAAASK